MSEAARVLYEDSRAAGAGGDGGGAWMAAICTTSETALLRVLGIILKD